MLLQQRNSLLVYQKYLKSFERGIKYGQKHKELIKSKDHHQFPF